jgi:hypothetical protein
LIKYIDDKEWIEKDRNELTEKLGFEPDLTLLTELYNPPVPHEIVSKNENEYNVYRIKVDGVIVRYNEDMSFIRITVEGDLPTATTEILVSDLQTKVSVFEKQPYELIRL